MTEIHCPACSALLQISVVDSPDRIAPVFPAPADSQPVVSEKPVRKETANLAAYNKRLAVALREFVAVHPWSEPRLSSDIHADFIRWVRDSPDESDLRQFLRPVPISKNRLSKVLVSELGAEYFKGPGGRLYSLPAELRPAPADGLPAADDGQGAAAGVDLAGAGSLEASGVASLPLADHVAAVRAQAAAEDAMPVPDTDQAVRNLVTGLGAVSLGSIREAAVETPDYELPEGTVLDGPSVIPVAEPEGGWTAPVTRKWGLLISDEEAGLEPADLEVLFMQRLPEGLLLQGAVDLEYRVDGTPALLGMVASLDGSDPGECWLPAPVADDADAGHPWPPNSAEELEAAAAPLPSPEQLAAAAGHDALERARARSSAPAAPVFLATEDYEGADPGDWG